MICLKQHISRHCKEIHTPKYTEIHQTFEGGLGDFLEKKIYIPQTDLEWKKKQNKTKKINKKKNSAIELIILYLQRKRNESNLIKIIGLERNCGPNYKIERRSIRSRLFSLLEK